MNNWDGRFYQHYHNKLFINLKKYIFLSNMLLFFRFVVSVKGIHIEEEKVRTILDSPTPTTVTQVCSFHGLATSYCQFIRNFNSLATPIIKCMKNGHFFWGNKQEKSFNNLKKILSTAPMLAFPHFDKLFEVKFNTSIVGIGAILFQEGHPLKFFSEKLNKTKSKWTTFELEFYVVIEARKHWEHHLIQR